MRLISCHINNFGNLKNKDFDFSNNLNTFFLSNGKGKSTLAYFIMAMFYGLDKASRTKFTDRLRFYPFDGQGCGGSLTFLYQDKRYRIERSFSLQSDTHDEIKVFINNRVTSIEDKDIGYHLFGIDKEAFSRTIFVTNKDIELKSNDTINTKLNNLAVGLNDDANLANALKILDNEIKKYQKQKSINALIPLTKVKIEELTQQKNTLEQIVLTLPTKSQELTSLRQKKQELDQTINSFEEINKTLSKWQILESYANDVEQIQESINNLKIKFGNKMPSLSECDEIAALINDNEKIDIKLKENKLNEVDEEKYYKLREKFQYKDINREIEKIEDKINTYQELENRQKVLKQTMLKDDSKTFTKFDEKTFTKADLGNLENSVAEYNDLKKNLAGELDFKEIKSKANIMPLAFVSLVGIIVAVVGIILVSRHLTLGISFLAIGFCLLLGAIFAFSTSNKVKQVPNEHKQALAKEAREKETIINQIFLDYGYDIRNELNTNLAQIRVDFTNYLKLKESVSNSTAELENNQTHIANLTKELDDYFLNYKIFADTYLNKMVKLKTEHSNFILLNTKFTQYQSLIIEGEKNKTINNQKMVLFKEKYQIDTLDIDNIKKDILKYNQEEESLKSKESTIKKYQEDNKLFIKPKSDFNLEELRSEQTQLLNVISKKKEEVAEAQEASETLANLLRQLEAENIKLEEAKETFKLLYLARKSLMEADENLKNKYISPIKDEFIKYAKLLEATLGEKIHMDSNYEIAFEREGKIRQVKHLSDGELAICTFCFRLALINKMYDNDKPFIILDDPFVALDEAHLAKMQTIIKELAKEQQLLYFTCHKSRTIEA